MDITQDEPDEAVVARITAGDVDSYGVLMARYEQKLLRYVVYLLHDHVTAADVVQDTFIKAYQNLRSFKPKYKFSSWIYRIAHNEAMNAVKKERHIQRDADTEMLIDNDQDADIVHEIDTAIMREDLKACLVHLDSKYREVLMLQYYENMKYVEIADILHIPVATVGVRAARAKAKLRQLCEKQGVRYE